MLNQRQSQNSLWSVASFEDDEIEDQEIAPVEQDDYAEKPGYF